MLAKNIEIDCHRWYCIIEITKEDSVEYRYILTSPGDGIYETDEEGWIDWNNQ